MYVPVLPTPKSLQKIMFSIRDEIINWRMKMITQIIFKLPALQCTTIGPPPPSESKELPLDACWLAIGTETDSPLHPAPLTDDSPYF